MWTTFWDMHSGGDQKEKWGMIFIEAPEEEAKIIFYNRFGHNPERVTCTCCGEDYSISENDSLEQATAFHRGCRYAYFKDGKEVSQSEGWKCGAGVLPNVWAGYIEEPESKISLHKYATLEEYVSSGNALVIYEKDILPKERIGTVPEQGYIWVD